MKHILKLYYNLMRIMKAVEYQTDDNCEKFKENTIEHVKAVNLLVTILQVPGCWLRLSKQLKGHLLFDWEIHYSVFVELENMLRCRQVKYRERASKVQTAGKKILKLVGRLETEEGYGRVSLSSLHSHCGD